MKNSLIITSIVISTISISAFGINKWNKQVEKKNKSAQPRAMLSTNFLGTINKTTVNDLTYKLDSRFKHNVTLENIRNATSIKDIIPEKEANSLSNYKKNKLAIILEKGESIEYGEGGKFNSKQLELLEDISYSTDLNIRAQCMSTDGIGNLYNYDLVYYMTVIPEKEASFKAGNDELIKQIKTRTKNNVAHVKMDKVKPGRVRFTITKEGKISKAELDSTCGYEDLDKKLVTIFNSIEGDWNPALNAQGEPVEQELVFFFGIFGC